MHEFSLAQNVIDIATKELSKYGKTVADEIKLEIGNLSGVEILPLKTALESFKVLTPFQETTFLMDKVEAIGCCNVCNTKRNIFDFFEICKKCGSAQISIIKGREFLIKTITMH